MDAFFASVEMINNPDLKDKPFIVGTGPNVNSGHGVATTANYKAREYSIHSAMRISDAKRLCPELIVVAPNWELIKEISSKVMDILRSHSEKFQQVSIDEAFIDVSDKVGYDESPVELAELIKSEISEMTKVTASIGIAESKEVAKIASDMNKPNGITFIPIDKVDEMLGPLSVRKIRGIGPKKAEFLKENEILTIKDLRKLKLSEMVPLFHNNKKHAQHFYKVVRGIDEGIVESKRVRKSIGKKKNFGKNVTDLRDIEEGVKSTVNIIYNTMIKNQFYFKTVTIEIIYSNFHRYNRAVTIDAHSNSKKKIFDTSFNLIKNHLSEQYSVRGIRITISNLKKGIYKKKQNVQKTLI